MEQETRTARDAGAPVKIGAEAVRAAAEVLRRYRAGKQNLDRRIIDNEQFWKLRHWEQMEKAGEGGNPEDVRPASGWLVNCILSKHADAMDCYPEPTVLPREPGDRQEAETLSRILPVLLKNDRFRRTYSKAWWDKLKSGCAVYGVFWDNEKLHGLGDVSIRSMDVLNLFWEPGGHGHTGVGALFLHGAGAQQPSGAEMAGAGGEAGARRRAGEPVSVRRQGGHVRAVAGGGLVLPHGA